MAHAFFFTLADLAQDDGLLGFCDSLIVIFCLYYFSPMIYSSWLCEWCFTIHWLLLGEVPQLCLTLCNPMDCSLPGSSIHGIFQARVLEWVAVSFSRESSRPRDWTWVSCIVGRRFTVRARKGHYTLLLGLKQKSLQGSLFISLLCLWADPLPPEPPGKPSIGLFKRGAPVSSLAISFSRGYCQARDQIQVFHIAGGFFTSELPGKLFYPYRYNCSSQYMCYGCCLIFGLLCKHSELSFPSPQHQKQG